jgi:organic radical activating enzyme
MLIENLRQQLSEQFNLICFEDLANLRQKHRAVFDLFKLHRKDRFEDNDRLIFYTSYDPEQDFLDHIQKAAARIDISNFFILIVCPFDLKQKLSISNKSWGYDDNCMQSLSLPLTKTKQFLPHKITNSNTLCAFPFGTIALDMQQKIRPCCKFDGNTGNLTNSSLTQEFQNDKINTIRKQMIAGQQPKECSICWEAEKSGTTSFRQLSLEKHGDLLDQLWLDDIQIRDISWSPSSFCNFKCRICGPFSSTSIAVEEIKFANDLEHQQILKNMMKNTTDLQKSNKVITEISKLDHLNFLHILGGEPLLWPQLSNLVDTLIENQLSKNIRIEFNTNCSIFPDTQIKKIIQHFPFVEILLSVDNIDDRFEIERGGSWKTIHDNIKKFVDLKSDRVEVKFATTINVQNILYLNDVIALADSLGIDIVWWYLENPSFLCIDYVTDAVKQIIHDRYTDHPVKELHKISLRIQNSIGSDSTQFIDYIHMMDSRRDQDFASTHKEIYQAMKRHNHS